MLFDNVVEDTFKLVFNLGRFAGVGLLCQNRPGKYRCSRIVRKIVFSAMFLAYIFGTCLLIFMAVPMPVKGTVSLVLDVYAAYAVIWGALLLDGFFCFITTNFSTKYLLDESDFVDRCRETALVAQPSENVLNHWKRVTRLVTGTFFGVLSAQAVVTVLAATGTVGAPVHMERVAYWFHIPMWLAWTCISIVAFVSTAHVGYHCIFFSNQCEIVRVHLRTFNDALSDERPISLSRRRVDLYHAEYCRLISMVQHLDCAFRISTMCQLSLVTVGSCLILYLLALGSMEWQPMIFIVFTLLTLFFTFSFTVIPAIMLDNQVYRPKGLVRSWFYKYERHCNTYGCPFDEGGRQALGLFMQSVNAEDAGITIASLAKLDIQLLLTLASVILTYFLVIVQMDQDAACNNAKTSASHNVSHVAT